VSIDRVYLRRACELAERGRGSTAPNPCVGAVIASGTLTLGEGYHREAGAPHAEIEALRAAAAAGHDVHGATLYVTLEPCDLQGRTPACTQAVLEAGIGRVVIGALDPNPNMAGRGVERLRESIPVAVAGDPWALALIEDFSVWIAGTRPYLTLKMAVSLDGFVAASPGTHWLTGERARAYVRELRSAADAVLVGAGTVRIDDPQLTVRPPRARRRPYQRVVACEADPIPPQSRVLARIDGYAPTIVLAPGGARGRFAELESVARVLYVGDGERLALALAFKALAREGISSVLCEGGPTLAGRLLAAGLVDRLAWLVTPQLFGNVHALRALGSADVTGAGTLQVDCVERLGDDLLVSARVGKDASCSAV
jgi:diaminohydroxyphosphoribosylaminopyrimidine deaminase/5-amino-6-(5-phosphoribosylamino)uracil reductase